MSVTVDAFFSSYDLTRNDLITIDDVCVATDSPDGVCLWYQGLRRREFNQRPDVLDQGPVITVPNGSRLVFDHWDDGHEDPGAHIGHIGVVLRVIDGPWSGLMIAIYPTDNVRQLAELAKIRRGKN